MDRWNMSMPFMMALVLMISISVIRTAKGQQSVPPCAPEIAICSAYINSTSPPNTCCNQIKHLYATEKTCLCQFIFTPGFLEGFGINTTYAVKFGHACGVDVSNSVCKAVLSALPPSSTVQPPAATRGADEGAAGRVAFTGISFVMLFWTLALFI